MVKAQAPSLKKCELIEMLQSATTSKERNRAYKLLKKFEPSPHHELDEEGDPKNLRPKEYSMLQAFMCFRCDKVKQSKIKVTWHTTRVGVKFICNGCYTFLYNNRFVDQAKRILDKAAYDIARGRV